MQTVRYRAEFVGDTQHALQSSTLERDMIGDLNVYICICAAILFSNMEFTKLKIQIACVVCRVQ